MSPQVSKTKRRPTSERRRLEPRIPWTYAAIEYAAGLNGAVSNWSFTNMASKVPQIPPDMLPFDIDFDTLAKRRAAEAARERQEAEPLIVIGPDEPKPVTVGSVARWTAGTVVLGFFGLLALGAVCALALKLFHWAF